MKRLMMIVCAVVAMVLPALAQQAPLKRVYDEKADREAQIATALTDAGENGRYVICQVGGNWCKWCLRLAAFIDADPEIRQLVDSNYVYLHVNYNPRDTSPEAKAADEALLKKLGNPERFGFPALVVLDSKGNVLHIQDSSFLESGEGYDRDKVIRFLTNWTPAAVGR